MNQIKDYIEFSFLVMKHLRKGVFTNCFLSKEEVLEYIELDNFKYISENNYLIFVREFDNRIFINFYLNDYTNSDDFFNYLKNFSKPVVFELPFKNSNESIIEDFEKKILENGFVKIQDRIKLIRKPDEEAINSDLLNDNYVFKFVEENYYDELLNLFDSSFDEFYGCIPTKEMIKKDILDNNIFGCISENKLIGMIRFFKKDGEITIKHLAIKSEYRHQKIGKLLVAKFIEKYNDNKIIVWTGNTNESAKKVYIANGFCIDQYSSRVYKTL